MTNYEVMLSANSKVRKKYNPYFAIFKYFLVFIASLLISTQYVKNAEIDIDRYQSMREKIETFPTLRLQFNRYYLDDKITYQEWRDFNALYLLYQQDANEIEIGLDKYLILEKMINTQPKIIKQFDEFSNDGRISIKEYITLINLFINFAEEELKHWKTPDFSKKVA